ncbi:hypothetical protein [Methylorubrum sp. POS3]|uniref:hypothetical protein n=1 Tax=Methylorubrum sp. POS3 TaxID=2998492 RepID=UPI00372B2B27
MLSDLQDLFSSTVQHAAAVGYTRQGSATYGTPKPYRARVLYRARLVRDARGNSVVARGEAWIAGTPSVGLDDALTLPDGSNPPILTVELLMDEAGPSHVHVFFG